MIVHLIGEWVQVNSFLRQRCLWCGALVLDYDLTRVSVPSGTDTRPAIWPPGSLVCVDGNVSYVVSVQDDGTLPAESCGRLDPEVTC